MSKIVIVFHSGYGHTAKVAQAVAEGSGGALLAIDAEGNLPAGGWEQLAAAKRGRLALVASPDGPGHEPGSVTIHADASIRAGLFDGAERLEQAIDPARITYVHLVRGALRVNDHALRSGDAARIEGEPMLVLEGGQDAEVLVFDLAR